MGRGWKGMEAFDDSTMKKVKTFPAIFYCHKLGKNPNIENMTSFSTKKGRKHQLIQLAVKVWTKLRSARQKNKLALRS